MSKSIKNSIILSVVFILVCSFDYYWIKIRRGKEIKKITSEKVKKEEEYKELDEYSAYYDFYNDSLKVLLNEVSESDKILLDNEDSRITFDYLNRLASQSNSYLNFQFRSQGFTEYDNYNVSRYSLNGDAFFNNIYNFIWKLENYKRLYEIESISLEEIKKADTPDQIPRSYIKFNILLKGLSSKEKTLGLEDIVDRKRVEYLSYNPFRPLVQERLPRNTEGLLDVSSAKLQGLTEDRAFIVDARGELKVMKVGDRVWLGYLIRINKRKNEVEFHLNKGGFAENVILKLNENK